jgi:eukaryotic-like serine/threonine-protein kinase
MSQHAEEPLYGETLAVGAQVGSWVVERIHHPGPVSILYRARDVRTGAPAALKVMHARFADASTALRRFRREAETLQRLCHPHIVGILEHGALPDGRPFIAMEWLEGGDLAAELASRGPLSPGEALEVLEQVGSALQAAHQAGVVHRDLKVQNVVRLAGGGEVPRVKLVDFGIAKGLSPGAPGASPLTHTGSVLGTPLSMAPEQIRGEPPDVRTDLYALGVLLFQLVTGRPPFQGATQHEVEEQHLHSPPPRASEHAPVLAALDAVIQRCMEKQREARYPDVGAVLEELRRAVQGGSSPTPLEHGVALYVEARVEGEPDDGAMERLEALLAHVSRAMRGAGLGVRVEGASCLLAVAPMGEDPAEARQVRARVLEAALALVEDTEAPGCPGPRGLAAIVHAGALTRRKQADPSRPGAEQLLCLSDWVVISPEGGLMATEAALRGVGAGFLVEPVPGLPGLSRVTGRH